MLIDSKKRVIVGLEEELQSSRYVRVYDVYRREWVVYAVDGNYKKIAVSGVNRDFAETKFFNSNKGEIPKLGPIDPSLIETRECSNCGKEFDRAGCRLHRGNWSSYYCGC